MKFIAKFGIVGAINEGIEGIPMLNQAFSKVYVKFKLHLYRELLRRLESREATLTTIETFCMEAVQALDEPTINEFANFIGISSPNAAYKINNLIKKGYLIKERDGEDRRIYRIKPTEKYWEYYNISTSYMNEVMDRIHARFSTADCDKLEEMLSIMSNELMGEVVLPN